MSSDERLALRAAQGDQGAFEEIYGRYHQDLYRFCLAMVSNPQDAQDALQNTMVKVLRGLPGEKRTIKLKPWLYRIARNEAIEVLRRRRDSTELEPQQATVTGVAEAAETRERLRTLLADLEQLPERQRAALIMRELSGLDFEQIGTAFGTSAAVARQTLYEARLSLRQLDAGREMRCADVMRELSNADGRITRRREIRAHLRSCADCRAFRDGISRRHEDLAALSPLPIAASAGLLHSVLGAKAGATASAAASGTAGTIGLGAGKTIATSALVKSAATVAVVAVVSVSAADRGGLVDLPLPGRGHDVPAAAAGPTPPADGAVNSADAAGNASAPSHPPKGSRASQQSGMTPAAEQGEGNPAVTAQEGSSRSEAGGSPPGGGHGRSAAQRHGRPDSLPAASE
jgi:RNA polymerase sigma factor (sigma-70 family)